MDHEDRKKLKELESRRGGLSRKIKELSPEIERLKKQGYAASNGAPGEIDMDVYVKMLEKEAAVVALGKAADEVDDEIRVLWRPDHIAWLITSLLQEDNRSPHDVRDYLHRTFKRGSLSPKADAALSRLVGLEDEVPLYEALSDAMTFRNVRQELETLFGRKLR